MNIFKVDSELIYDVAFIHNKLDCKAIKNVENKSLLGVITYEVYRKYVNGVPLNKEEFFETWLTLLSDVNVLLEDVKLFYTTKEDRIASIEFKQFVEKNYHIELPLIETSHLELLISEIKSSNIVISARMHALILGFTYERKIVTYPISSKLIQFKKMIESDIALSDMQAVIESQFFNMLNNNSYDEK
jgi:polysaccharide pyruvyl transferase WcaK-like protein